MSDITPRDSLAEALDTNAEYREKAEEKAEEKARAKKDPVSRLDEIRERHAARLRTRAAKGDGAVQMSTLVDDDVAWLLDAHRHMVESWQTADAEIQALQRVRTVLIDEWGMASIDGTPFDEDFTEAIQENGAWRLARDLRAALAPVAPDAEMLGGTPC